MLEGTIVKNISNAYTVLCGNEEYTCVPRGKFRQEKKTPLVGDHCLIDSVNNYILDLYPRKNELHRPSVANVDVALIVTSMKAPDFSPLLLDKEISSILLAGIIPVICFTKLDLLEEREKQELSLLRSYYEKLKIRVFDNTDVSSLLQYLKNKIVVLTGQTGAGKSTLINKVAPDLNLKTDEISHFLNRGKHTTRHTEIFRVHDVWLCDTPGFSSLELKNYSKEEIRNTFLEFQDYGCRFQDCMHLNEPGCGVKEAVSNQEILASRYENYQKMLKERDI